tara:strand:+ start:596 stop:1009 length:414 start_codon:yes stop_codon:yes gene_type:complete
MEEFQINQNFVGGMIAQGVFTLAMLFLLWMMFRANTLSHERGSNLIQKILSTVISAPVIIFNLGNWNNFGATFNNWAYSLSKLDSLSAGGQNFVDQTGATAFIDGGLIPSDPVSLIFWAGITIALFLGIWTAPGPKE